MGHHVCSPPSPSILHPIPLYHDTGTQQELPHCFPHSTRICWTLQFGLYISLLDLATLSRSLTSRISMEMTKERERETIDKTNKPTQRRKSVKTTTAKGWGRSEENVTSTQRKGYSQKELETFSD